MELDYAVHSFLFTKQFMLTFLFTDSNISITYFFFLVVMTKLFKLLTLHRTLKENMDTQWREREIAREREREREREDIFKTS
jgi:hypothetical protein